MGTQPENTHGFQTQTQPNPYPKFDSGSGITLGYPNFGYPIPTILTTELIIVSKLPMFHGLMYIDARCQEKSLHTMGSNNFCNEQ